MALREALDDALAWGTSTPYWDEEDWGKAPGAADDMADDAATVDEAADAGDQPEIVEDEWFEPWRPALPAARETDLDAACAELDKLLFGDRDADPGRVAALGAALLASPELEN